MDHSQFQQCAHFCLYLCVSLSLYKALFLEGHQSYQIRGSTYLNMTSSQIITRAMTLFPNKDWDFNMYIWRRVQVALVVKNPPPMQET